MDRAVRRMSADGYLSGKKAKSKGKDRAGDHDGGSWRLGRDPFAATNSFNAGDSPPRLRTRSKPPTIQPPRKAQGTLDPSRSNSILGLGKQLFRRASSRDRSGSTPLPPSDTSHPSRQLDGDSESLVLDIRATPDHPPYVESQEEAERGRLRNAAAQSIGLRPNVKDPPPPIVASSDNTDNSPLIPTATTLQPPTPRGNPFIPLPNFPAPYASLFDVSQFSSSISKHSATHLTGLLTNKTSSRNWKSRQLLLTSTASAYSSSPDSTIDTYLHLFKGNFPNDREIDRLFISSSAQVFVPEDTGEVAGRHYVLKVVGLNARAAQRTERGIAGLGSPVTWTFQSPDPMTLQRWLVLIRGAIVTTPTESIPTKPSKKSTSRRISLPVPSLSNAFHNPYSRNGSTASNTQPVGTLMTSQTIPATPSAASVKSNSSSAVQALRGFLNPTPNPSRGASVASDTASLSSQAPASSSFTTAIEGLHSDSPTRGAEDPSPVPPSPSFPPNGGPVPARSTSPSLVLTTDDKDIELVSSRSGPAQYLAVPLSSSSTHLQPQSHAASLMLGIPITPIEERGLDYTMSSTNPSPNLPQPHHQVNLHGGRASTGRYTSFGSERERERDAFSRLLANGSGGSISTGRPMSPNSVLSLPPPPRSRRPATSSHGSSAGPHRPRSPMSLNFPSSVERERSLARDGINTSRGSGARRLSASATTSSPQQEIRWPSSPSSPTRKYQSTRVSHTLLEGDGEFGRNEEGVQTPTRSRRTSSPGTPVVTPSSFGHGSAVFGDHFNLADHIDDISSIKDTSATRTQTPSHPPSSNAQTPTSSIYPRERDSTPGSSQLHRKSSLRRASQLEHIPKMLPPPAGPPPEPPQSASSNSQPSPSPSPSNLLTPFQISPLQLDPRTAAESTELSPYGGKASKRASIQSVASRATSQGTVRSQEHGSSPGSTVTSSTRRSSHGSPFPLPWTHSPSETPYRHPFASPSALSFGYDPQPQSPNEGKPDVHLIGSSSGSRSSPTIKRRPSQRSSLVPPPRPAPQGAIPRTPDGSQATIRPPTMVHSRADSRSSSVKSSGLTLEPIDSPSVKIIVPGGSSFSKYGPAMSPPPTATLPVPPVNESNSSHSPFGTKSQYSRRMSEPHRLIGSELNDAELTIRGKRATVDYHGRAPPDFSSQPRPALSIETDTPRSFVDNFTPSPSPSRPRATQRKFDELAALAEVSH